MLNRLTRHWKLLKEKELAPQAGLEPATLRLTALCRLSILLVLRGVSSDATTLLPGVREQIVH